MIAASGRRLEQYGTDSAVLRAVCFQRCAQLEKCPVLVGKNARPLLPTNPIASATRFDCPAALFSIPPIGTDLQVNETLSLAPKRGELFRTV